MILCTYNSYIYHSSYDIFLLLRSENGSALSVSIYSVFHNTKIFISA